MPTINNTRHKDTQETSCSCSIGVSWLLGYLCTHAHPPSTLQFLRQSSQDVEGDSDDDIPELEEQGGGEDSAEVRGGGDDVHLILMYHIIRHHGTRSSAAGCVSYRIIPSRVDGRWSVLWPVTQQQRQQQPQRLPFPLLHKRHLSCSARAMKAGRGGTPEEGLAESHARCPNAIVLSSY